VAGVWVSLSSLMMRGSNSGMDLRWAYIHGYMSASKVSAIHFWFRFPCVTYAIFEPPWGVELGVGVTAGVGVGEAMGSMLGGVDRPVLVALGLGSGGRLGPGVAVAVGDAAPVMIVPAGDDGLGEPVGWANEFRSPSTKMTPATAPKMATTKRTTDGRRWAGAEEGPMAHSFCRAASHSWATVLAAARAF